MMIAMSALKAAASVFQGHPDRALEAAAYAEAYRGFLTKAKAGQIWPIPPSVFQTLTKEHRKQLGIETPVDNADPGEPPPIEDEELGF